VSVNSGRLLLGAGVVVPLLFIAVFLVEGLVRPRYDPLRHQVSLLSLGDQGWIQIATFIVSGLLVVAFAFALRSVLGSGRAAVGAPVAIAIAGIGLVLAGLFTTVPAYGYPPGAPDGLPSHIPTSAYVHVAAALCFFLGLTVGAVLMGRRFAAVNRTMWAVYSIASGVVTLVFFAASSAVPSGQPFFPPVVGLLQHVSLIAGLGWFALLALHTATSPRALDLPQEPTEAPRMSETAP
jgi:hypothetical membrane protein